MTLTKADIARQVWNEHPSLSKAQSMESVEQFLAIAKATMAAGENLLLSRFGKFNVKDKKPRRGRNPRTGGSLELGAHRVVTFKQSSLLRERINATSE